MGPPGVIAAMTIGTKSNLKGYKIQGIDVALIPGNSQSPHIVQKSINHGGSSPKYDFVAVDPNSP